MSNKFTCLLFISGLFLTACSKVYSPAMYHQDIAYQPKPASFDSVKSATYISAGFDGHTNTNFSDLLLSGQINLSRGHAFKNFNIAYGAFGVFGDYQNGSIQQGDPNYFNDKFFGAVGGRFSANLFTNIGRTDFRFIGVEMAYSHEFGSYANYRQQVVNQPDFYTDPRTNLLTVGLTTEVYFHNIDDTGIQHGIRGFVGTTFGHNPLDDTYYFNSTATDKTFRHIFPKASYFIKFKDYFGSIEAGSEIFIRFGYKF